MTKAMSILSVKTIYNYDETASINAPYKTFFKNSQHRNSNVL